MDWRNRPADFGVKCAAASAYLRAGGVRFDTEVIDFARAAKRIRARRHGIAAAEESRQTEALRWLDAQWAENGRKLYEEIENAQRAPQLADPEPAA